MKAITYNRYGAADVLAISEVPQPVPEDDEILIRVKAVEATKADTEMRSFKYSVKWFWLPLRLAVGIRKPRRPILGGYFSGEVAAVGKSATHYHAGQAVFGSTGLQFGAYAQYMTLPGNGNAIDKPANMSHAEAAAVPLGGLNALHFLRLANLQPGEQILVNGAGGSIGAHAVQIAKAMGAEVTGVDAGRKATYVRQMGADHFIDYQQQDFTQQAQCYDVIFDMVPGSRYSACIRSLRPGGRYMAGNPRLITMARCFFTTRFTDKEARFAFAQENRDGLASLKEMIEAGQITSIVDQVFPMTEAASAHRLVETEQRIGAIVLELE
ncbi:MAG: NAD(P)-dependent alcohol dehydrogenase [Pseudomonadota bacterium]